MQQAAEAAQSALTQVTAEDVKAYYEAKLKAALDRRMASAPEPQVAELQPWWDLISIGPIQPVFNPPFAPSDVIRSGELAFVVTILLLNPDPILPPGVSPCDILSKFALPYEVTYQTGNLTTWKPAPAPLTSEHEGQNLVPGQCFYIDVLEFVPDDKDEVMYEMNVSARIFGCGENYAPPFAGFAREVVDIDSSFWSPPPGLVSAPIRFLVYGDQPEEI
jgi:hypothetical protein